MSMSPNIDRHTVLIDIHSIDRHTQY